MKTITRKPTAVAAVIAACLTTLLLENLRGEEHGPTGHAHLATLVPLGLPALALGHLALPVFVPHVLSIPGMDATVKP